MPRQALDLIKLPGGHGVSVAMKNMAEDWQAMIEEVKERIKNSNAKYKAAADKQQRKQLFAVGDQVMVFLRRERFPLGQYNKLQSKKCRPYQIVKKINDNVYVVALPDSIGISKTFNVMRSRPFTNSRVMGVMRWDFGLKTTKSKICWIWLIGTGRLPNPVYRLGRPKSAIFKY